MTIVARTTADGASAVPSIQRAIWSINPRVSFAGVETLDGLLRDTLAQSCIPAAPQVPSPMAPQGI